MAVSRLLLLTLLLAGCIPLREAEPLPTRAVSLPSRKQIRVANYLFLADFDLQPDQPLLRDLAGLSENIYQELRMPPAQHLVQVHLFPDRQSYDEFLAQRYPELPARRAYFIATLQPGGTQDFRVYSFWGDHVQKDLRHELTHATLHGTLSDVPLWLDEGLAEYFEVPPEWQGVNSRHLKAIQEGSLPFSPDLVRLETLKDVGQMSTADYCEAWGWVHFLLKGPARPTLLKYLADLRAYQQPEPLSSRLSKTLPNYTERMREHIVKLTLATRTSDSPAGE